jgi:hypothetical protein
MTKTKLAVPVFLVVAALAAAPSRAEAEIFVHRDQVLPGGVWAIDFGLGIGHVDPPGPVGPFTGLGFNLEIKGGLTSRLQLGVRTGIRVGDDGKITQADRYGRTFETETYGTGAETLANPEISLRLMVLHSSSAELGVEGRLYIPIEAGTDTGVMLAVPLAFHFSPTVRLDTGIFVPIIFSDPTRSVISFPFHLWLQASDQVAVGPITGIQVHNPGGSITVPLGLGLNYGATSTADLRFWFLFPNIKGDGQARNYGAGIGVEARF